MLACFGQRIPIGAHSGMWTAAAPDRRRAARCVVGRQPIFTRMASHVQLPLIPIPLLKLW